MDKHDRLEAYPTVAAIIHSHHFGSDGPSWVRAPGHSKDIPFVLDYAEG
jgi:hypothetical protein